MSFFHDLRSEFTLPHFWLQRLVAMGKLGLNVVQLASVGSWVSLDLG